MPGQNIHNEMARKPVSHRLRLFVIVLITASAASIWGVGVVRGIMAGFDIAALAFIVSLHPLLKLKTAQQLKQHAMIEDESRTWLLAVGGIVSLVILGTVTIELDGSGQLTLAAKALVVVTLALCWVFGNLIYSLHYAHMHYSRDGDDGGLYFPGTDAPDYWDFIYFGMTLGMTFQTSDVEIRTPAIRKIVLWHTLAAFVFNLGIIGFTINLLGSN